jgi:prevent-host-death family protein
MRQIRRIMRRAWRIGQTNGKASFRYGALMTSVSLRDLRNHADDVVDRAAGGEEITITRSGRPVAELRPLPDPPLRAEVLLRRWRRLPLVDAGALRSDLGRVLDARL